MRLTKYIVLNIVAITVATMFFSCSNDMELVKEIGKKDSIPEVIIDSIRVLQSERGNITLELKAPVMYSYNQKEKYTEFPKGVRIIFYDSLMKPKSELTAKYGISYEGRKIMEARGNVVVMNYLKKASLNTEHLIWNENTKRVSTNENVKITEPDRIIFGKGLESDELFDNWIIRNVTGTMYVKE